MKPKLVVDAELNEFADNLVVSLVIASFYLDQSFLGWFLIVNLASRKVTDLQNIKIKRQQ